MNIAVGSAISIAVRAAMMRLCADIALRSARSQEG
jgi:hypothetical protein